MGAKIPRGFVRTRLGQLVYVGNKTDVTTDKSKEKKS